MITVWKYTQITERRWSQNNDTTDQQHMCSYKVVQKFHSSCSDYFQEIAKSYKMHRPSHIQQRLSRWYWEAGLEGTIMMYLKMIGLD
jgi:hypothetical protein